MVVALCLPEIRPAPSRESWWDDGVPGTDRLPYQNRMGSDKRGGLNGSTQHSLKVHVQQSSMKLNSFKGVDANGTLPCLGSD